MPTTSRAAIESTMTPSVSLILDFLNTRGGDDQTPDGLETPNDLIHWSGTTDFSENNYVVTPADVLAAREFRDALAIILESHAHAPDDAHGLLHAEALVGRFAELHPIKPIVTSEACRFEITQTGIAGAVAQVLVAVATTASEGNWDRLKDCNNPTCHTAFYDQTRNGSGRFCSSNCTSKVSMRAYRARRKSTQALT